MEQVPEFELESEVMENRLRLRKYVRELYFNRARMLSKQPEVQQMLSQINEGGFQKLENKPKEKVSKISPVALPDRKIDTDSEDAEEDDD